MSWSVLGFPRAILEIGFGEIISLRTGGVYRFLPSGVFKKTLLKMGKMLLGKNCSKTFKNFARPRVILRNCSAKVLVIGYKEKRKRYEFLMQPLKKIKFVESKAVIMSRPYWLFFYRLLSISCKFKPNVIIAMDPGLVGFSAVLISKLIVHKPVIGRIGGISRTLGLNTFEKFPSLRKHNFLKETLRLYKNRIHRLLTMYSVKNFSYFFVVSNYLGNKLANAVDLKGRKVFVVPQCHEIRAPQSERVVFKENYIRLLTVTDLKYSSKYKGVRELIGFLQKYVKEACPDNHRFVFEICGDGYFYHYLLDNIGIGNIEDPRLVIHCNGFVDNLDEIYKRSDLFIYTSYIDFLPNVLLEAQSYGLPILINDYPGFYHFMNDYWNAVFYRSGDFEDFRKKLKELIADSDLRQFLTINGINSIMRTYSPEAIAGKLEKILKEVL
jgi:glycosyltransferase involved in cell wall biosynthesis